MSARYRREQVDFAVRCSSLAGYQNSYEDKTFIFLQIVAYFKLLTG